MFQCAFFILDTLKAFFQRRSYFSKTLLVTGMGSDRSPLSS